jgi:hypothetical protein
MREYAGDSRAWTDSRVQSISRPLVLSACAAICDIPHRGIMPVVLVKWIMAFRGSGVPRWWCCCC